MFFLPYEVDVPQDRRPVMNWVIIGVTLAAFVWELTVWDNDAAIKPYLLTGWHNPVGWITCIFLHGGLVHLIGNMIFLWVFGNAVCAKVGNVTYLPLYLVLGLAADFAHMALQSEAALGASGAINGIVGVYLVFFPINTISCAYVFWSFIVIRTGVFSVSGYWMILFWLVFNILCMVLGAGDVGYSAHVGGFVAGVVLAILLIKLKVVKMERDELSLLQVLGIDKKPELSEVDVFEHEGVQRGVLTISREVQGAAEVAAVRRKMAENRPAPLLTPESATSNKGQEGKPETKEAIVYFTCACGKSFRAPPQLAGKKGKCPKCGAIVTIPG